MPPALLALLVARLERLLQDMAEGGLLVPPPTMAMRSGRERPSCGRARPRAASATPLTRSSYHADADFAALRAARQARLAGVAA